MKIHSSLNPDFDAANAQILADLHEYGDEDDIFFICDICGAEYPFDNYNKPGMFCAEENCSGKLDWDKDMIKLPDNIKTGKKTYHGSSYSSGAYGGSSNVVTYENHKHLGDKVIYDFNGKQLFASNGHSIDKVNKKWDLIIDLAGVITMPNQLNFIRNDAPKRFGGLNKYLDKDDNIPCEVLRLYWNDMGVPPCGIEFWEEMWKILPAKTVIACIGGHGRTGTCIASLMIAAGEDYYEALDHVRKEHCHKAVEVLGQEKYLHAIYVERLQYSLKAAKAANAESKVIKDIVEDIEYALKNVPSYQTTEAVKSKVETKGSTTLPFDQTVAGSLAQKEKAGSSSGDLVDADGYVVELNDLEQEIKTVGEKIYVKECTNVLCMDVGCREASHMGWVEWDFTEEGVV